MLEKSELVKVEAKQSQVVDFVQAFGHTMIESPVNGLTQVVNHAAGTHLPEMNLIGRPEHNSIGTAAGNIAGAAVDYYVLSRVGNAALGNLGGNGIAGSALRSGLIGGVYAGLLTPSDASSSTFFKDRLQNSAIGATTFAAMSGASGLLNQSRMFAVPEIRSLAGSMTVGGLSGVAGGSAHAESTALCKDGSLLPSTQQLLSDSVSYAAFGAAFGAMDYGYYKYVSPPRVSEINATTQVKGNREFEAKVKVTQNAQGEVIKLEAAVPSREFPSTSQVGWKASKMGDGSWSNRGYEILQGSWLKDYDGSVLLPKIIAVQMDKNGSLMIKSEDGDIRTFGADGKYTRSNPETEAAEAQRQARYAEEAKQAHEKSLDRVDRDGIRRITTELKVAEGKPEIGSTMVSMKDNQVQSVNFNPKNNRLFADYTEMRRVDGDTWSVFVKDTNGSPLEYRWKGEVKPITGENGKVTGFQLKSQAGAETSLNSSPESLSITQASLMNAAQLKGFAPNWRYIRMDNDGNVFVKTGAGIVNGAAGTMQEVPVKPGDAVTVTFDIGDRGPYMKDFPIQWTKSLDGTLLFNNHPLKPNSAVGLDILTEGAYAPY